MSKLAKAQQRATMGYYKKNYGFIDAKQDKEIKTLKKEVKEIKGAVELKRWDKEFLFSPDYNGLVHTLNAIPAPAAGVAQADYYRVASDCYMKTLLMRGTMAKVPVSAGGPAVSKVRMLVLCFKKPKGVAITVGEVYQGAIGPITTAIGSSNAPNSQYNWDTRSTWVKLIDRTYLMDENNPSHTFSISKKLNRVTKYSANFLNSEENAIHVIWISDNVGALVVPTIEYSSRITFTG